MKAKIIGVRVFKDITSEFVISVPEFELPLLQQANDSDVGDDEGRVSKISEDDGVFEYDETFTGPANTQVYYNDIAKIQE